MQTVSRVLAEMYTLAEVVPMQAFPRELLTLLKSLVPFDGAVLGRGYIGAHGRRRGKPLLVSDSHDGSVIVDCLSRIQVCRALKRDSAEIRPLSIYSDCPEQCTMDQAQQFAGQTREVMFLEAANTEGGDWLALCRENCHAFNAKDRACLCETWPHVVRSLAMNRKRHLDERFREADGRAAAIVTLKAHIDIADTHFRDLLAAEWPDFAGDTLPPAVLNAWRSAHSFHGTRIEIRFREQNGSLLCIARPHATLVGLTKTEGIVARHFASGLSHREVAQALGVSENTIRTHLKQAYSKLGVHDKAQLANRIGSSA